MGLFNQVIVSSRFGAGKTMDAYFIATTLPMIVALLLINTMESAVIPVYTRIRTQGNKEQASRLFSTVLNFLLLFTLFLTIFLFVFRRQVVIFSAPALDQTRVELAVLLTPFIYPTIMLTVVIGFLECILNTEGQFGLPAYAGLLVPISTAAFVLTLGLKQGVIMMCIGTLVGLCLQLLIFFLRFRGTKLTYRFVLDIRTPEIASIVKVAWPVFFGSLIGQASPLIDQMFASFLSAGSISALSYSLKITSMFSGVIFTSVGRAALPYLSRQAAMKDMKAFKDTLRLYLWGVGSGTTVLSIFILIFAHLFVKILFQRGAFTAEDTNHTANTLIGLMIGLTPMAFGFILSKAFSALGKTKVLMGVSAFSVVANALFDYTFAHFWQSEGIALATSVVYLCTMCILLVTLHHMIGHLNLLTPPSEIVKVIKKLRSQFFKSTLLGTNISWSIAQGNVRKTTTFVMIASLIFVLGIMGTLWNAFYMLRISLGSIAILALLRYRYLLLNVWILSGVFIGTALRGYNLDTGLTLPTILLLISMPLEETLKRMPVLRFLIVYIVWVLAGVSISAIGLGPFFTNW